MAKLRCVCGHVISMSDSIPNRDEWRLAADSELEEIRGLVEVEVLYLQMRIMYRCPVSDHLWIFWDGLDAPPTLYAHLDYDG